MVSRAAVSRHFPPGARWKGRLKLKWSKIGSNGAKCLSPLKECPLDPLKVIEFNQFFLGGLKQVSNQKNQKKGGYFGLCSAVSNLQTLIGGHHPVL